MDPELVTQINGDTGETLTKSKLRIRSIRCAQNLTKLGCTQDDRIGVSARNHHNLTPLLYGAIFNGSPICPFNALTVKYRIYVLLDRVRPSFIFCDADVLASVKEIVNNIGFSSKFFIVNGWADGYESIDSLMNETGDEDSFVKIEDAFSYAAVISCSSGSTSMPKVVGISHAHFIHTLKVQFLGSKHTAFSFSSMFWIAGTLGMLRCALTVTRVFTAKPFSPDLFFDFVEKYKIHQSPGAALFFLFDVSYLFIQTIREAEENSQKITKSTYGQRRPTLQFFFGPPCQIQAFLKSERCENADLSSLLVCFSVGGFVPSVLVQTLKKLVPKCLLLTTYGMTEVCGSATCTLPNELEEQPNSGGRLVPGFIIKIINENTGEKCGIGEEGEIYIKTLMPSVGYYKDETATRNSFDKEGYFISGDLGYFDGSGRLIIIGRKKEIFKNCGFAIWPAELESLIVNNPAIKDASVVSVFDDDIMSDLPAAVVVKKESHSITEDEVYAIIADKLASYKRLDGGVYFVDELPMTPSGKIIRPKVKEITQNIYQQRKLSQKS
ncbi:probable 4-coumarate--CoA ligase 1 [Sitodiplosis mosellana]|uniref:probable 4-coumarate--CoA ligase 1 n=1 Tax=Sitodiplosis mosellana TaxID=263140 RepID=UPI00244422A1|nr:probable 4-coumarate--CoA ligase 1 [Sitodiplosis mosellana]